MGMKARVRVLSWGPRDLPLSPGTLSPLPPPVLPGPVRTVGQYNPSGTSALGERAREGLTVPLRVRLSESSP